MNIVILNFVQRLTMMPMAVHVDRWWITRKGGMITVLWYFKLRDACIFRNRRNRVLLTWYTGWKWEVQKPVDNTWGVGLVMWPCCLLYGVVVGLWLIYLVKQLVGVVRPGWWDSEMMLTSVCRRQNYCRETWTRSSILSIVKHARPASVCSTA